MMLADMAAGRHLRGGHRDREEGGGEAADWV